MSRYRVLPTSVAVEGGIEDDGIPVILHSLHGFLQTVFLAGRCTDHLELVQVRFQIVPGRGPGGALKFHTGDLYNIISPPANASISTHVTW